MRKDNPRHSYKSRKNKLIVHCLRKEDKHNKNARDYEFNYRRED